MEIIDGALRVGGRGEDRALVVVQDFRPGSDIGGVVLAVLKVQPEISAQERRAKLGNELFGSVAFVAEALAPEVAIKPALMPGRVRGVDDGAEEC